MSRPVGRTLTYGFDHDKSGADCIATPDAGAALK